MEAVSYLTYLAIIILLGIGCILVSRRFGLPNALLLLLMGFLLSKFFVIVNWFGALLSKTGLFYFVQFPTAQLISFPFNFLESLALLALVVVLFDSALRFRYHYLDDFSFGALKLACLSLILNLIFISLSVKFLFGIENWLIALFFSALVSGISFDAIKSAIKNLNSESLKFIESESLFSTFFMLTLPFALLTSFGSFSSISGFDIISIGSQLMPLVLQVVIGAGVGVIMGLMLLKFRRRFYLSIYSTAILTMLSFLTYIFAEYMGGSGILAVAVTGSIFGNMMHSAHMKCINPALSGMLESLIFVLVGMHMDRLANFDLITGSLIMFLLFLILRFISFNALFKKEFHWKEKLFMTLVSPKGLALGAVVLFLANRITPGLETVLNVSLLFLIYSSIISSILLRYSKWFVNVKVM